MADSDNDGIPDTVEVTLGSNPNLSTGGYDSDGNGVGDGVELAVYGSPCQDAKCSPTNARSFATLCGAKPAGGYPDTDGDFLNDCEEKLLASNPISFDSNNDWVPDEFEWVNNVSFAAGTNTLLSDPLNDGLTEYTKLKENLPVKTSVNSIVGYQTLNYQMTEVSDSPIQTCYNVNVQNLATVAANNLIRLYIMEARGAAGNVPHMRTASKTIVNASAGLSFQDGDFNPP